MASRAARAIYLTCCGIAALLVVLAAWVLAVTGDQRIGFAAFLLVPAVAVWLVGWVFRYVLTE